MNKDTKIKKLCQIDSLIETVNFPLENVFIDGPLHSYVPLTDEPEVIIDYKLFGKELSSKVNRKACYLKHDNYTNTTCFLYTEWINQGEVVDCNLYIVMRLPKVKIIYKFESVSYEC